MICPSCQKEVSRDVKACPECGWKFQINGRTATAPALGVAVRAASRAKLQVELDIAATVDRTGSSHEFASGIARAVEIILRTVQSRARDVKVHLQSHGDLDYKEEMVRLLEGGSIDEALTAIRTITYGGGGDAEETHLDAIENLLNLTPWIGDPRRSRGCMVAFLTQDTKPPRSGKTAAQIGEEIRKRGIFLLLVCHPTPTLRALVESATGMMFAISNNPSQAELESAASKVAASISASIASAGTAPMTLPRTPTTSLR